MKLNKIALALFAVTAAPLAANAGVTISPLLLGYHYSEGADDDQADLLKDYSGNGNSYYKEDGLYTGAALGIELTPSTQFQEEYGVSKVVTYRKASQSIPTPDDVLDSLAAQCDAIVHAVAD